ncbi:MAG: alpha/beta hydrolase [Candidatus Acidiferrales bacterium]
MNKFGQAGSLSFSSIHETEQMKLHPMTFLRHRATLAIFLLVYSAFPAAAAPQSILLWPNGAPGSEGKNSEEVVRINEYGEHIVSNVHHPSITPYLPSKDKATGAAVIIVPGGGHSELWMGHEGYNVAQWLSDHGTAAFVLKYRLAREKGSTYTIEGNELPDIQRAIRLVKSRASEWGLDPRSVGVMGFSAGGELAALASTRYDTGSPSTADPIERESSKPAFQALLYPAIPHDMSLSAETPPAFLACGEDDRPEIAQGLPGLYLALKRAGGSAELHVYAKTGHGFGVRESNRPPVSGWLLLFHEWLDIQGFLRHK